MKQSKKVYFMGGNTEAEAEAEAEANMDPIYIISLVSPTCHHCVQFDDIWKPIQREFDGNPTVLLRTLSAAEVVAGNEEETAKNSKKYADEKKILEDMTGTTIKEPDGYPTLIKIHNKKSEVFNNDRDFETIVQWIKS